ncbi:hypothetical protein FSARC_9542 [Fusarium sarcochroum]|uniref:Uncharacterized protein n=1 Tax=Fusarium sarcochroum TaxID=1208366 RepID=A0A8H4TQR3_9HYPO|nr:hypothetical protein FSARC_9542 [Fusarium sarcochroum]
MSSLSQPKPIAQVAKTQERPFEQMQMDQPKAQQPMDTQKPQPDTEPELNLRGGEDCGGYCRGRFCFIIPCPIPINCCVIPL